MKTILAMSLLVASIAMLNTGCSASASVKPNSDASKVNMNQQIAYVTAPAK
jgi:hypothetical protein